MATDQIRQMVNFILQEAHEKANEIRVKVGSKFVGFVGGTMNGVVGVSSGLNGLYWCCYSVAGGLDD